MYSTSTTEKALQKIAKIREERFKVQGSFISHYDMSIIAHKLYSIAYNLKSLLVVIILFLLESHWSTAEHNEGTGRERRGRFLITDVILY